MSTTRRQERKRLTRWERIRKVARRVVQSIRDRKLNVDDLVRAREESS